MKRNVLILVGVLAAVLVLAGMLNRPERARAAEATGKSLTAGTNVTVFLRADILGSQYPNRMVDTSNLCQKKGTISEVNDDWVVLRDGEKDVYIVRQAVVMIEVAK
ncbi:MAG TPA: hypothetical protein VIL86_06180 [Tepidisphaeraceae bacterium]|jgi:hypothetical protein